MIIGANKIYTAIDNYSVHVLIHDLVYHEYLKLSRYMSIKVLPVTILQGSVQPHPRENKISGRGPRKNFY